MGCDVLECWTRHKFTSVIWQAGQKRISVIVNIITVHYFVCGMSKPEYSTELRETVDKRYDVLAALASKPQTKPELVDTIDLSRSTIDRAVGALEDTGCIKRRGSDYHLTQLGHVSLDEYTRYRETITGVAAASDVIDALPADVHIDPVFFRGVTVHTANPHAPESALGESIEQLESTDQLLGLAPVVLSLYTDVLTDLVSEHDLRAEILLHENTLNSLVEYYQDGFSEIRMADYFDFFVTDQDLPYALWIMERDECPLVGITVHEKGGVRGVLMNDSPDAVSWARKVYEQYRDQARRITVDFSQ